MNPQVKVIMSSGFSEHEVTQKFAGAGLAGFVHKPYKLLTLRNALRGIENPQFPNGEPALVPSRR